MNVIGHGSRWFTDILIFVAMPLDGVLFPLRGVELAVAVFTAFAVEPPLCIVGYLAMLHADGCYLGAGLDFASAVLGEVKNLVEVAHDVVEPFSRHAAILVGVSQSAALPAAVRRVAFLATQQQSWPDAKCAMMTANEQYGLMIVDVTCNAGVEVIAIHLIDTLIESGFLHGLSMPLAHIIFLNL